MHQSIVNTKKGVAFLLLVVTMMSVTAQEKTFTNLFLVKKGRTLVNKENDYLPSANGFCIYRNCLYNIILKNKKQMQVRVLDISDSAVIVQNYPNSSIAFKYFDTLKKMTLTKDEIKSVKFIGDRSMGLFETVSLQQYDWVFVKDTLPKKLRLDTIAVYKGDTTLYELIPLATQQGLDLVYEKGGMSYYFQGIVPMPEVKEDSFIYRKKNVAYFLPSNANEINGLAAGLMTMNFTDSMLKINGLNVNADILSGLMSIMAVTTFFSFKADTSYMTATLNNIHSNVFIKGVSISGGGVMGAVNISGVVINGVISHIDVMKGIAITGANNSFYKFSGVSIAGIRNDCFEGKGLQIGLINYAGRYKGVQLGLWNMNSKRSLPFINWSR